MSLQLARRTLITLITLPTLMISGTASAAFVNEIHYDNTSTDAGEAIEIAGTAGTDLSGWSLVLYNGNPTQLSVYDTRSLSGIITDQQNGYGTLSFSYPVNGIQNGNTSGTQPDGIALVDNTSSVVQFLSYEGIFTAADGAAAGLTSTDIGVAESGTTPVGYSLQLVGTGSNYGDFSWSTEMANSFGDVNTGQLFVSTVPVPAAVWLLGSALFGLAGFRRKNAAI